MDADLYRAMVTSITDRPGPSVQHQALCIDGPYEGQYYALRLKDPVAFLGPLPGHPYRAVEDDDGTYYYVYADSLDDFPLATL